MTPKIIAAVAMAIAALPGLVVFALARSIIFHPTHTDRRVLEGLAERPGWSLEAVPSDGETLIGLVRTPTQATSRWLVFFGGNAFDLPSSVSVSEAVASDLGIVAFAYRGYDGSSGSPSAAALHADGLAIVRWLGEKYGVKPADLVVMGHSIGTGVAARLAADLSARGEPPAALVLGAPYRSMRLLIDEKIPLVPVGWAVRDPFDTESAAGAIRCPVLLVHGVEDGLIPVAHGRALAAKLGDRARLIELPGVGHNDVWSDRGAVEAVRAFARKPG